MGNNILDELADYNQRQDPRERHDPRRRVDVRKVSENERVPIGSARQQLTTEEREGYHRHWINDVGDRIEKALAGGYTFIPKAGFKAGEGPEQGHTDLGSVVSKIVGTKANGEPLRAYRMEIPIDWYRADQERKHEPTRELMREISRGKVSAQDGDTSHRYIPEEGIDIGE